MSIKNYNVQCVCVCVSIVIAWKNQVNTFKPTNVSYLHCLNRTEWSEKRGNEIEINNNKIRLCLLVCLISWQTYLGVNGAIGCSTTQYETATACLHLNVYEWHIVLVSACLFDCLCMLSNSVQFSSVSQSAVQTDFKRKKYEMQSRHDRWFINTHNTAKHSFNLSSLSLDRELDGISCMVCECVCAVFFTLWLAFLCRAIICCNHIKYLIKYAEK